jgi:hypothetical protein
VRSRNGAGVWGEALGWDGGDAGFWAQNADLKEKALVLLGVQNEVKADPTTGARHLKTRASSSRTRVRKRRRVGQEGQEEQERQG